MAEYCRLCAQTEVNEQTIENHIKFNIKQSIDVDCSENYFKNNYKKKDFPFCILLQYFSLFKYLYLQIKYLNILNCYKYFYI